MSKTTLLVCLAPSTLRPEPISLSVAEAWLLQEIPKALDSTNLASYWTKRAALVSDADGWEITSRFDIPSEEANQVGASVADRILLNLREVDDALDEIGLSFDSDFRSRESELDSNLVKLLRAVAARRTLAAVRTVSGQAVDESTKRWTYDLSLGIPFLGPCETVIGFPALQVLPARIDQSFAEAVESAQRDLSLLADFPSYQPNLSRPTVGFRVSIHS
jgi:hypothetical protein